MQKVRITFNSSFVVEVEELEQAEDIALDIIHSGDLDYEIEELEEDTED